MMRVVPLTQVVWTFKHQKHANKAERKKKKKKSLTFLDDFTNKYFSKSSNDLGYRLK